MLNLVWDDKRGTAKPEGLVKSWVDSVISEWKFNEEVGTTVLVGQADLVVEFMYRAAIGEIPFSCLRLMDGDDIYQLGAHFTWMHPHNGKQPELGKQNLDTARKLARIRLKQIEEEQRNARDKRKHNREEHS